jgi:hypothetical protein
MSGAGCRGRAVASLLAVVAVAGCSGDRDPTTTTSTPASSSTVVESTTSFVPETTTTTEPEPSP